MASDLVECADLETKHYHHSGHSFRILTSIYMNKCTRLHCGKAPFHSSQFMQQLLAKHHIPQVRSTCFTHQIWFPVTFFLSSELKRSWKAKYLWFQNNWTQCSGAAV